MNARTFRHACIISSFSFGTMAHTLLTKFVDKIMAWLCQAMCRVQNLPSRHLQMGHHDMQLNTDECPVRTSSKLSFSSPPLAARRGLRCS